MSPTVSGAPVPEKLAIDSGHPVRNKPFAPWPAFTREDIEAVSGVLRSGRVNYWTGDEGRLFEQEFARYTDVKYAVAVASGTVALELALYALGIGPGAEVITPGRTFIASASCIALRGAIPVMADVDRDSQTITAQSVREVITPRTRAIIAVHLAGWPCDMDSILQVAEEYELAVIEDCAQAHGARYKGRPVGSMGHIGAFSFCQDKTMTTGGEGGMLTMSYEALWNRASSYRDHGRNYQAAHEGSHQPGFRWLSDSFGTNWRLTEMQSALGRSMLRRLDQSVDRRTQLAGKMNQAMAGIPAVRTTLPGEAIYHSYYKYYVFIRLERLRPNWNRDRIAAAIEAEGIPCSSGSCSEIYLERAFEGMRPPHRLLVAKELGETSLMFLVHPTLSDIDIQDTIAAVEKVMQHASY